jgi:hypothetical protein
MQAGHDFVTHQIDFVNRSSILIYEGAHPRLSPEEMSISQDWIVDTAKSYELVTPSGHTQYLFEFPSQLYDGGVTYLHISYIEQPDQDEAGNIHPSEFISIFDCLRVVIDLNAPTYDC